MVEPQSSYASERLIMRPWRNAEADRLLDIRSRRGVVRWLSDPDPWTDVATAQQAIAGWAHRRPPLGVWAIVPKAAGVPAGTVSLGLLPDGDEVEIGWYLHPDSQGRGYAREAARAALRHALANGVWRVWAIMWPQRRVRGGCHRDRDDRSGCPS